jgi:putative membrane protein insertion efficiency factor
MKIFKSFCIACVKSYRFMLSPLFFSLGVQCRFTPTCSEYAQEAIEKHGPWGIVLTSGRILRCHPFCEGGHDPVPQVFGLEEQHHG